MISAIGIIGLGLLGGSVAHAARASYPASVKIHAYDVDYDLLLSAKEQQLIDYIAADVSQLAACDVIVIAVPITAYRAVLTALPRDIKAHVTDVASVKQPVIDTASQVAPNLLPNLVPAHPLAGSEKNSLAAAGAGYYCWQPLSGSVARSVISRI